MLIAHQLCVCAEWLRQLLEPALAATLNNDPAATAAASAALTALATLEGIAPGSLQNMLLEVLVACQHHSKIATGFGPSMISSSCLDCMCSHKTCA